MPNIIFKIATENIEFEQIHQLNYQTFVEEIPQHPPNAQRKLVDQFHAENTYVIGLCNDQVIAMSAVRDRRPFSLDKKLENLDAYLPSRQSLCEFRLLAIAAPHRTPRLFQGLLQQLAAYGENQGYDLAVMSGTVRQAKLYRRLGFVPFGPLVGAPAAQFQPMYLTLHAYNALKERSHAFR